MFELIQSISIDAATGIASGKAIVPAEHPLFADHFPGAPLMPGSLLIELAAQIAGPLAEQVAKLQLQVERWSLLGMIRDARFLRPVTLPAPLEFSAEVSRVDISNIAVRVEARCDEERVLTAQLVMMLFAAKPEWEAAIRDRNERLASWKGVA